MKAIRLLQADEIEVRVQTVKDGEKPGCSLLLYKDARVDMKILDETFGSMNWERHHELINGNLFCTVRIWDDDKKMWVSKQDVGTESNAEKEKGQASDAFKRACFNIGIGRELYTAPFVWVNLDKGDIYTSNGKTAVKTKFRVSRIEYNDRREIVFLEIKDHNNVVRYSMGEYISAPQEEKKGKTSSKQNEKKSEERSKEEMLTVAQKAGYSERDVLGNIGKMFGKDSIESLSDAEYQKLYNIFQRKAA